MITAGIILLFLLASVGIGSWLGSNLFGTRNWTCVERRKGRGHITRRWVSDHGDEVEVRAVDYGHSVSDCWYNTRTGSMDLELSYLGEAEERKLEWEAAAKKAEGKPCS